MPGRDELQLHIVINMDGIPPGKLPLLFQYLAGRAAQGLFACLNISLETSAAAAVPFVISELTPERVLGRLRAPSVAAQARIDGYFRNDRYRPAADVPPEALNCTSVVVLGVGIPEQKLSPTVSVCASYKEVSGIRQPLLPVLAQVIHDNLIARLLRRGGRVRVQCCHARSAQVRLPSARADTSFAEAIAEGYELSAPACFSVVHPSGSFLDVVCLMKQFERLCKVFHQVENGAPPRRSLEEIQLRTRDAAIFQAVPMRFERYEARIERPDPAFEAIPSDSEEGAAEQLVSDDEEG